MAPIIPNMVRHLYHWNRRLLTPGGMCLRGKRVLLLPERSCCRDVLSFLSLRLSKYGCWRSCSQVSRLDGSIRRQPCTITCGQSTRICQFCKTAAGRTANIKIKTTSPSSGSEFDVRGLDTFAPKIPAETEEQKDFLKRQSQV